MSSEDERYDLLIGFLEGELDDDERELVEGELAGPGDAQDRLEAYRGLGAALAELEPPAPSTEARDRAYAAVLAAMAEGAAAAPVEAPTATAPTEIASTEIASTATAPSAPQATPRGQLLRFMSALAAAALVMVSAVFYLGGLESPRGKVAMAPKKVRLEDAAPLAQAREAQAEGVQQATPQPEGARFSEAEVESELAEPQSLKPELAEGDTKSEVEEKLLAELKRERAALAKKLEEGGTRPGRAQRTSAAQSPSPSPILAEGEPPARAPAAPPAEPRTRRAAAKGFRQPQDRDNEAASDDAPSQPVRRPAKRAAPKENLNRVTGEPRPSPGSSPSPDSEGVLRGTRQGGARSELDPGSGGGGAGGGGASGSQGDSGSQGEREDMQAQKGKSRAGEGSAQKRADEDGAGERRFGRKQSGKVDGLADGASPDAPLAGRRGQGPSEDGLREEELGSRSRRELAKTSPRPLKGLQPAWIVTRGRERALYVMEGSKLTQGPISNLPLAELRAKAKKNAAPVRVKALWVQTRALAAKREPVDLRVLERREDLLAIAKLELASEAKAGSKDAPLGGSEGPGIGAASGRDEDKTASPQAGKSGQQEPQRPTDEEGEEDSMTAPGAKKRALPPPATSRERAELLLRLLGAVKARRLSRAELERALLETERRQDKARRRR